MESTVMTRDTIQDRRKERRAMIDSQLRTSGVNEEFVLARMMAIPREAFLPSEKASLAYIDRSIRLGPDRHLASPLFYGKLLQEADPLPSDTVMIVGAGTDYLAKLIEPLVSKVSVTSPIEVLEGAIPEGAFSLVLVEGAIEDAPAALVNAIEEGGRLVSGLASRGVTRLASGKRFMGKAPMVPIEDMGIPVISAFDRPKTWTFS